VRCSSGQAATATGISVFAAFLCGLVAMAKFFRSERTWPPLVSSFAGPRSQSLAVIILVLIAAIGASLIADRHRA
jgi:hypothetical protein